MFSIWFDLLMCGNFNITIDLKKIIQLYLAQDSILTTFWTNKNILQSSDTYYRMQNIFFYCVDTA